MNYQVLDYLLKPLPVVLKAFLDLEKMKEWQESLLDLEVVVGLWPQTGFVGYLIYDVNNQKSKMKITVIENKLPQKVVFLYEVEGVKNKCSYYFENRKESTGFLMDVQFEFADGITRPLEPFQQETSRIMKIFKEYVEKGVIEKQLLLF